MNTPLEPGLTLISTQPDCIKATFSSNTFASATDNRGTALLFERFNTPAVFIEAIRTLPGTVRGNHVHKNCNETLNVTSGELNFYLLCNCPQRHVYMKNMKAGDTVVTFKGVPHALQAIEKTDIIVFFEQDPRQDRERVQILTF